MTSTTVYVYVCVRVHDILGSMDDTVCVCVCEHAVLLLCRTSPRFVSNLYHLASRRYGLSVIFEFVNKSDRITVLSLHINYTAMALPFCTHRIIVVSAAHVHRGESAFGIMEELGCHCGIRAY